MADHSEVKAAVAAVTDACPFLWVDPNNRSKLDSSTSADEPGGAWEVLETERRIGISPLRSWSELSNEERIQVINTARARLAAEHDSDNYQGVHMLMYSIGAYEGTGLERPSIKDAEDLFMPTMVSDFTRYTSALDRLCIECNTVAQQNSSENTSSVMDALINNSAQNITSGEREKSFIENLVENFKDR